MNIPAVIVNDTCADRHHGCWRVMRTLRSLALDAGIDIIASSPAHADWRLNPAFARALGQARLIIINGEGTIHHDRPAGACLLEVGAAATALGVPAALINLSWQSNSPGLADKLKSFALIAAREERSAREIRASGVACSVVPDLSLFFEPTPVPERHGVGFTDSVVRSTAQGLDAARRRLGGSLAPIQFSRPGIGGLLRTVREGLAREDLARPASMARSAMARFEAYHQEVPDDLAYMERIAGFKLLVTGRFHAAAFAMAAKTPLLALDSNTHKIGAMLEDAGLGAWRRVGVEALTRELLEAGAVWSPDELSALEAYLAQGRARTRTLFADLAGLAA